MTPRINTTDYVRPTTAARLAGLTRGRIVQLTEAGLLPSIEIDGVRHYHRRDVDRLRAEVAARRAAKKSR